MSIPVSKRAAVHCSVVATLLLAGCGGLGGGLTPTAEKLYSVDGIVRPLYSGLALQRVGVRSLGLNLRFPPKRSKSETFYLSLLLGEVYNVFKLPKTKPFCESSVVDNEVVNSIATTSDGDVWLPSDGPPTGIIAYAPGCGVQTLQTRIRSLLHLARARLPMDSWGFMVRNAARRTATSRSTQRERPARSSSIRTLASTVTAAFPARSGSIKARCTSRAAVQTRT
jgi:hypothetical protein